MKKLDHRRVHRLLFARSDRNGGLRLSQTDLAAELGVSKFVMCRLFSRLEEEGRIKRIRWGYYAIRDPKTIKRKVT